MLPLIFLPPFFITHVKGPVQEPAPIFRQFSPGESLTYKLDVDVPAQKEHISATIHWHVTTITREMATVHLTLDDAIGKDDKNGVQAMPPVAPVDWEFRKSGMSSSASLKGDAFPYSLLCLASYLPSTLTPSHGFNVDWSSKDGSMKVAGSGSSGGLQDMDGGKAATLKLNITITGSKQMSPSGTFQMANSSWIDPANGRLLKADGTLTIEKVTASYSLKQVKTP